MDIEGFRSWLLACGLKKSTAESRVANCIIIELEQHVNLDECYANDKCERLIGLLTYSHEEQRRNRPPRHSIPIDGNVYDGTATYKSAVKKYVAFKDAGGMVQRRPTPPKKVLPKGEVNSVLSYVVKDKKNIDGEFARILRSFRKWLVEDADLKPNSADQYKTYINKLRSSVDGHFGPGHFESMLSEYLRDLSEERLIQCSSFIKDNIRNAPETSQKTWSNWRSAFYELQEFLHDIADVYTKDAETLCKEKKKGTSAKSKRKATRAKHEYDHQELVRAFMGRLKTQSRYYPKFGKFGLLFPTRLLTKIFKRTKHNIWVEWLKSDIKDMRILESKNSLVSFADVSKFEFQGDGTVLITKDDGTTFEMMTRKANKKIEKEFAMRGLRDVSIDHVEPLEKVLGKNRSKLEGLGLLTKLFKEFEKMVGYKLNPRVENDWVNNFYDQFRHVLDTDEMRARIEADLKKINLKFELMDTKENSIKGKDA